MLYQRILSAFLSTPWALRPETLHDYAALLALRASGSRLSDEDIAARIKAGQEKVAARGNGARVGSVAVLPILGTFLSRASAMQDVSAIGSTQQMEAAFKALVDDDAVGAIVLDMDTPGGESGGVEEFATTVFNARAKKPVIAIANVEMCSAGFWIGSAASELVVSPSSIIGSVGVWSAHEDLSKFLEAEGVKITLISAGAHKIEGNPFEPLGDEARAYIQKLVDECYEQFVKAVARGRNVSQATVRDSFGRGRVVHAAEAVKLDMADQIGTLDDAIALAARRAKAAGTRAVVETPKSLATESASAGPVDDAPAPTTEAAAGPDDDLELLRLRMAFAEAGRR